MTLVQYALAATFCLSLVIGQILFKIAAGQKSADGSPAPIAEVLFTVPMMAACFIYAVSVLLYVFLLQRIPLSRAYMFSIAGAAIVPILAVIVFKEPFSMKYVFGLVLVLLGIAISTSQSRIRGFRMAILKRDIVYRVESLRNSFAHYAADSIAVSLIALVWFLFCAFFVLGNYQTTNGDYGQYYMHAQNMLNGRDWDYLVERYPAVLPGWPVVLALLYTLFGTGAYAIGLLNTLFWVLTCLLAWLHFKDMLQSKWAGYLMFLVALTCPYALIFQQEGQPNLFYVFAFTLAFFSIRRFADSNRIILLTLCVLLPATIRLESIVIYIAMAVYVLAIGRRRLIVLPLCGIALTVLLDVLIASTTEMRSNFSGFYDLANVKHSSGEDSGILLFLQNYAYYLVALILNIPHLLNSFVEASQGHIDISAENRLSAKAGLLSVFLTALAAVGFFSVRKTLGGVRDSKSFFSFERLLFMGHLAFTALFLLRAIPPRYLLSILPIYVYFLIYGVEVLISSFRLPQRFTILVTSIVFLLYIKPIIHQDYSFAKRKNFLYSEETTTMADHLASIKGERQVGFWKGRLITVLLYERNVIDRAPQQIRAWQHAEQLFSEDGIFAAKNNAVSTSLKEYLEGRTDVCVTWKHKTYTFYELKAEGRTCLEE